MFCLHYFENLFVLLYMEIKKAIVMCSIWRFSTKLYIWLKLKTKESISRRKETKKVNFQDLCKEMYEDNCFVIKKSSI